MTSGSIDSEGCNLFLGFFFFFFFFSYSFFSFFFFSVVWNGFGLALNDGGCR